MGSEVNSWITWHDPPPDEYQMGVFTHFGVNYNIIKIKNDKHVSYWLDKDIKIKESIQQYYNPIYDILQFSVKKEICPGTGTGGDVFNSNTIISGGYRGLLSQNIDIPYNREEVKELLGNLTSTQEQRLNFDKYFICGENELGINPQYRPEFWCSRYAMKGWAWKRLRSRFWRVKSENTVGKKVRVGSETLASGLWFLLKDPPPSYDLDIHTINSLDDLMLDFFRWADEVAGVLEDVMDEIFKITLQGSILINAGLVLSQLIEAWDNYKLHHETDWEAAMRFWRDLIKRTDPNPNWGIIENIQKSFKAFFTGELEIDDISLALFWFTSTSIAILAFIKFFTEDYDDNIWRCLRCKVITVPPTFEQPTTISRDPIFFGSGY